MQVWGKISPYAKLDSSRIKWLDVVHNLKLITNKNNIRGLIGRLIFGASVYFVWQERSHRLFNKGRRSGDQLFQIIFDTVWLKIMSLQLTKIEKIGAVWKISDRSEK